MVTINLHAGTVYAAIEDYAANGWVYVCDGDECVAYMFLEDE